LNVEKSGIDTAEPCKPATHWNAGVTMPKLKSWPISRVLSWTAIHLRRLSPNACSDLPGSRAGRTLTLPYLVLLRVGFTLPRAVAWRAVCFYHTFSPLPPQWVTAGRRFVFCGTFRRLTPPRHYLAPCPMEPGLSSVSTRRLSGQLFSYSLHLPAR